MPTVEELRAQRNAPAKPGNVVPMAQADAPVHLPVARGGETAATAMAEQVKAIIQARYEMAVYRPRDIDEVRARLLKECSRPMFAEVAEYNKPVGDGIKGPSIRFVETAIRCMTNIVITTTTKYDDDVKRIMNVSVTDLESNVPYDMDVTIEKSVERRQFKDGDVVLRERLNSKNQKVYTIAATDDDILNKQNALISKAIRTQGLRLIPGDLVEEAMYYVHQTLEKKDAQDPDAARLRLFDSFGTVGVTVPQIKAYLGHDGKTLTPKELQDLRGLYAALRDGETSWREIMDNRKETPPGPTPTTTPTPTPTQSTAPTPTEEPERKVTFSATTKYTPAAQNAQQTENADEPPFDTGGEQTDGNEDDAGKPTFEELVREISRAKDSSTIRGTVMPLIMEVSNDEHREALEKMANNAIERLDKKAKEVAAAKSTPAPTPTPTPRATPRASSGKRPNFE